MNINNLLVGTLCACIPFSKLRKKIRRRYLNKFPQSAVSKHKIYGKIYTPIYNLSSPVSEKMPEIYNKEGQRMESFFLRDLHFAHNPNIDSQYFIFDRYNLGLKTHFYSHNSMLETCGNPDRKYGFLIESEAICPQDYKIFEKHRHLAENFEAIFTYSADILNKLPNAHFAAFCAVPWSTIPLQLQTNATMDKTKNISFLSSHKVVCDLHRFRLSLAQECKQNHLADTYGTFDGGNLVNIDVTLHDYRFSIAIENDVKPYFFTERLTSCFLTQTVPVYLGATEIDKFFNPDGIIKISPKDYDNIEAILKQCTKEEYEQRLPAILDNYQRVQSYHNIWDKIYEEHLR